MKLLTAKGFDAIKLLTSTRGNNKKGKSGHEIIDCGIQGQN